VQPGLFVTEKTFNMHLEYLKANFKIIHVKELLERYFDGESLHNCCAISFDDGWRDNYYYAFPLLKKHSIPSSFFLATGFIESEKWFWEEEVSFFIKNTARSSRRRFIFGENIPNEINKLFNEVEQGDVVGITSVVYLLKGIPRFQFDQIVTRIREKNKLTRPQQRLMMDWAQIEEMYKTGLAKFYSHSHSHEVLTGLSGEVIEKEVLVSKSVICDRLNCTNEIFCYPSGRYDSRIISILQKNQFQFALSTERGFLSRDDGRYCVKRIGVHDSISKNLVLFRNLLF
jgi:peptidoglycan/xylan/chitin deacetylase (PgdA/CDA1 family)